MRYSEYLPRVYREIEDYGYFGTAMDSLLDGLWQEVENYCREVELFTMEENLYRWEKILSLSGEGKTTEERRRQILSRLNVRLPYTKEQLARQLTLVFEGDGIEIEEEYGNYRLLVGIPDRYKSFPKELKNQLRQAIPANLELYLYGLREERCDASLWVGVQTADRVVVEERSI